MIIWDPVMFNNEFDMLDCRLEAMKDYDVQHILVEAPFTHMGVPKPLHFEENLDRYKEWLDRIIHVTSKYPCTPYPWVNEHTQRNAAWPMFGLVHAEALDPVLICDLDEIPSPQLLEWRGGSWEVAAVQMRSFLFAVDWEVADPVPPTCVVATAGYLFKHQGGLAAVRDGRGGYLEVIKDGGWHFSWVGGPEAQREKLETASCHRNEIDSRPEGALIRDGTRYRTSENGGGLAVVPVEVDESFPAYVRGPRCPPEWRRPR